MSFTERLNQVMDERGWRQIDLCRASGLTSSQVAFLVTGKTKDPGLSTATKVAKALNVSLEYLAGIKDDPTIERRTPISIAEIETVRLVEDFESLPEEGRGAILDQLEFQKMKSSRAAEESLPDNPLPGIA